MKKNIYLVIAVTLMFCGCSDKETDNSTNSPECNIYGTATDETGSPVQAAKVALGKAVFDDGIFYRNIGTVRTTVTGSDGQFAFNDVAIEKFNAPEEEYIGYTTSYYIEVTKVNGGFKTFIMPVALQANKVTNIDVLLQNSLHISTGEVSYDSDGYYYLYSNISYDGDDYKQYSSGFYISKSENVVETGIIKDSYVGYSGSYYQGRVKATDLLPNTTYYVCAFAKNSTGIFYGNITHFTTK